jgi:MFS family permease
VVSGTQRGRGFDHGLPETIVSGDSAGGEGGLPTGAPEAVTASAASGGSRSRLGVLRHGHFRNIWLAALVSSVGGWMEMVGIQWVMAQMTSTAEWRSAGNPGPTLMMAYLGAAQLGPTLVLGIVGGLTADRVNRKTLLLVTQALLMLIAGGLTAAAVTGRVTPGLLLAVSLANGTTMAFNIPAWQVLTPRLVPREELTKAIHLNGIQFNLARVAGPGLGGVLLSAYGAPALFAINTASFVGILVAVAWTPDAPAPRHDGSGAWARTREAMSFVFHKRGPLRVMIGLVLFSMLAAPMMRMLPLFVTQVYHAEERTFGTLLSVMGIGAVAGGLGLRFIPAWYPKHHFIPLSVMLGGVSLTAFASATSVPWAGVTLFFSGIFWLWSFNSSVAALQLLVEDRMRGRVMAISNTFVFGAMPAGSLLAGLIAEWVSGRADDGFGTQVGVGALSVALTAAGLVMLIWRTPEIDGIKPGEAGFERRPGLIPGLTASAHRPMSPGTGRGG